jgi:hypothetical protein
MYRVLKKRRPYHIEAHRKNLRCISLWYARGVSSHSLFQVILRLRLLKSPFMPGQLKCSNGSASQPRSRKQCSRSHP